MSISDDVYRRLQEPLGKPLVGSTRSKSDAEIRMLKFTFTPSADYPRVNDIGDEWVR